MGDTNMYKFKSRQISFTDFNTPIGMKLNPENRWVKKAEMIPWDEIEQCYAKLFTNRKGNVAKPLRLALGACIIQAEYGFSDEEVALQIQETAYLQFFCGYSEYNDEKLPFDPSLMVYFRKRLTPEILGEINEMIIQKAETEERSDEDDNTTPPSNSGTMIVDATCAPSQIKYPQDTELLNEAREITEKVIDELHVPGSGKKPRTYRKKARKQYLHIARSKKRTAKKVRKAIGQQLSYIKRNLKTIENLPVKTDNLPKQLRAKLETVKKLYEQQKYMYDNHTHSVSDRIVSISQPWLRPIVRGKAKAPVEFGAKLDISVVNGFTRLEYHSFNAYNEALKLSDMIERYKERTGSYPERILADKIYRNRENLAYCAERKIRLSGPALGRPKKDEIRDKKQDYIDESERIEVERKFSLAKRKCGIGLIVTRLKETTCHCLAMSVLLLNLRKIGKVLFTKILIMFQNTLKIYSISKMAFIQ
jgi:IS5 family transposase